MSAEAETIGGELVIGTRERILERALEASRAEVDRREGFWGEGWKTGRKAGAEHARREMEILRAQLGTLATQPNEAQGSENPADDPAVSLQDVGADPNPTSVLRYVMRLKKRLCAHIPAGDFSVPEQLDNWLNRSERLRWVLEQIDAAILPHGKMRD